MTKQEYQRLRRTALKRMARLTAAGLSKRLVTNYGGGAAFPTYTQLKGNAKDFAKAAVQLQQFLKAKTSTVSGAKASRKRTGDMLKMAGLTGIISNDKIDDFGEFMKAARAAAGSAAFDSDQAVSAFTNAKANDIDAQLIAKNFDKWISKNLDKKVKKRGWQVSNKDIQKLFNGDKKNDNKGRRSNGKTVSRDSERSNGRRKTGTQKKKK